MELYVQECKPNLKNASESSRVQVVLGNESVDLDSAVSSIVFAFFLYKSQKSSEITIPVLNVNRNDLAIKTEVVFFLENTSIPLDQLICIDEIDLKEIQDRGNLDIVLVDHNVLSDQLSYLEPSIRQIVDHHEITNPEITQKYVTNIEKVSSCTTLIAEHIFNSSISSSVMDPQVAMLLYGTILLDSANLNEKAKRATNKDKDMVSRLEVVLGEVNRDEVFNTLRKAKTNVSNLTHTQLLKKDAKYISDGKTSIALCSIPSLLQDLVCEESFQSALKDFLCEKDVTSILLLGIMTDSKGEQKKEIAIFDTVLRSLDYISNYLLNLKDPSLELKPLPCPNKSIHLYNQTNTIPSRKFILPAMQEYLNKSSHPGLETTTETNFSYVNGDKNKNSVLSVQEHKMEDDPDEIPTYQPETMEFPDSPNHSRLLNITLQLQSLSPIPGVVPDVIPTPDELNLSTDARCGTLKRIAVNPSVLESKFREEDEEELRDDGDARSLSSLSNRSEVFSHSDDIILDDDAATLDGDLDNDSDFLESCTGSDPIPEVSAAEEFAEERSWRSCCVGGEDHRIDMKVIEPYRKVLSHGGYEGPNHNAVIVFSACFLPDRSRKDYDYVMDNLFLYVIVTLDELVAEDYILVYLHGATERSAMPSFSWLRRCYQMIDRRLRKNLKGLYLVHPTFWLKTIVIMTRPFISSKFSHKLKFVYSLKELSSLVSLDHVSIPEKVKHFDEDLYDVW